MKRILSLALMAVSAVAVSGCKYTTIDDGKIPAGYEQYARAAEGTYVGTVGTGAFGAGHSAHMREITLKIAYANDRITMTPSVDFLGEKCGSKIGHLISVETSGTKLSTAVFSFTGGKCASADRMVVRMFKQSSGHPKLVVWVTTGYGTYYDQTGPKTTSYEVQADVRKQ